MQKGGFFSLGTCPEAIIFTLVGAEPFRDMLLPAAPNMQPRWMISSLLSGEGEKEIDAISIWHSCWPGEPFSSLQILQKLRIIYTSQTQEFRKKKTNPQIIGHRIGLTNAKGEKTPKYPEQTHSHYNPKQLLSTSYPTARS